MSQRRFAGLAGTYQQHRSGAGQGFMEARAYLADARDATSCGSAMSYGLKALEAHAAAQVERTYGGRYRPAYSGGKMRKAVAKVIRSKCGLPEGR